MTQLEDGESSSKREYSGPREPFPPSDPGAWIVFLVGTGETYEEQKEWMAFVRVQLSSAGDHPITEAEIRERWKARENDPFYTYSRKFLD